MNDTRWTYSFSLWPASSSFGSDTRYSHLHYAQECLKGQCFRQEQEWTEAEFKRARAELETVGLEMHEIERVPRAIPEQVP